MKRRMGSRVLLTIAAITTLVLGGFDAAAVADSKQSVGNTARQIAVEKDIVYGTGGGTELKLNLARPEASNGLLPALVYIHGGGWQFGDRKDDQRGIEDAARRGYVAIAISYRLTEPDAQGKARNPFPAQIQDVKCAVRWLRANAEKYHVDPNRIGAVGGSAGGHLSLLVGMSDSSPELEGSGGHAGISSKVQAVVNYFGPTDLVHLYATSKHAAGLEKICLGGTPETAAERYRIASPITYVSKDNPPILTLQGTADEVVPADQATLLDAALKKAGASHTLILLEGQGHGFRGPAAQQARDAQFKFFDEHLKKG